MRDYKGDCHVSNVKLELNICDPGRIADNCVHRKHQNELIEVLKSSFACILEHIHTYDDSLHDDLECHDKDLPDQYLANQTDRHTQGKSAEKEEAWLQKDNLASLESKFFVNSSIFVFDLWFFEVTEVAEKVQDNARRNQNSEWYKRCTSNWHNWEAHRAHVKDLQVDQDTHNDDDVTFIDQCNQNAPVNRLVELFRASLYSFGALSAAHAEGSNEYG